LKIKVNCDLQTFIQGRARTPDKSKARIYAENSSRQENYKDVIFLYQVGQGRPIKAKQEFPPEILADKKITWM
jgi:hypothetical protein